MTPVSLKKLREIAPTKAPGYLEEALAAGEIHGDFIRFDDEVYRALREKYSSIPSDEPVAKVMPSLTTQAVGLLGTLAAEAVAIVKRKPALSNKETAVRVALCEKCESFDQLIRRCAECGCYMDHKAKLRAARCPLGKW